MATLGTLASGLGHDLRNLIMPVLLRLDVVTASNDLSEKARSDLASIRQSMLRLQRLAGGLRLLASDPFDQRDEAQLTTLPEWWADLQPIVHDALPPHSVVQADIAEGLPVVAVPPGTLAQILINLVMNSRQAMEHTAMPKLSLVGRTEGGRVLLDVADTPENLRFVFLHPQDFWRSKTGQRIVASQLHQVGFTQARADRVTLHRGALVIPKNCRAQHIPGCIQ
jgi:C4-dicarboxylate-specific signal transduction histidine kinase